MLSESMTLCAVVNMSVQYMAVCSRPIDGVEDAQMVMVVARL